MELNQSHDVTPQGLQRMVGQDAAVHLLRRAMQQHCLHHALLFEGPKGVGKSTCAHALFAALNCSAPPAQGEACGTCMSCRKIRVGTHPDWIPVASQGAGLADEIESLLTRVFHGPHEGAVQFVLVDPAENLALPQAHIAANRLLKTLEEPPPRTHFVFVVQNASVLLPTLRSRMQRIRFSPLSDVSLRQCLLQCHPNLQPSEDHILFSQGSMGALVSSILNQDVFQQRQSHLNHMIQAAIDGDIEQITALSALEGQPEKEDALQTLEWFSIRVARFISRHPDRALAMCFVFRQIQEAHIAIRRSTAPVFAMERLLREIHPFLKGIDLVGSRP